MTAEDVDGVVVFGGTNDYILSVPIGQRFDTNTATFFGGLNTLMTGLLSMYQGKPIIFCTPIRYSVDKNVVPDGLTKLTGSNASQANTLQVISEAIMERCRYYGIQYVDLFDNGGFSPWDLTSYYDGLHPSENGHKQLAGIIQHALELRFNY